ncbi:MAG: 50S ribosomal protein L28 [Candidatus Bipolaricaulia bacterium]
MAQVCEICGKQPDFGQTRSHSNRATKRKRRPNIQRIKVWQDGRKVRVRVCTRCLKAGKVNKAIAGSRPSQ